MGMPNYRWRAAGGQLLWASPRIIVGLGHDSQCADDSPDLFRAIAGSGAGRAGCRHPPGTLTVTNEWLALAIFLSAAATDMLDGYLARRWSRSPPSGRCSTPIADKLLVSAALISLVQVRALPGWMAILIIGREFRGLGVAGHRRSRRLHYQGSDLGKTKMVSQVVAISCSAAERAPSGAAAAGHVPHVGRGILRDALAFQLLRPSFWAQGGRGVKNRRRRELLTLERKRQRAAGAPSQGIEGRGRLGHGYNFEPPEVN